MELPNNLLIKLILAPLIILASTLVSRRWGEKVGGLMIGLPLTSAPVSIFFTLEQGPHFAADAARGAILGLIPVVVFCVSYIQSARRFSWYICAIASILMYMITVVCVSFIPLDLTIESILVPLVLGLGSFFLGKMEFVEQEVKSPWWDIPLRIIAATALLIIITSSASSLGPQWGGMLSPFPIFTFVMATFSHSQGGAVAAWRFIRSVLIGLFSYAAFFVIVALLIEKMNIGLVYTIASITALIVSGILFSLVISKYPSPKYQYTHEN